MTTLPTGDTFVGLGPQPYDEQADLEGVPAFLNYGMRDSRQSWRNQDHLHLLRDISPEQQHWNASMNEAIRYGWQFEWWLG